MNLSEHWRTDERQKYRKYANFAHNCLPHFESGYRRRRVRQRKQSTMGGLPAKPPANGWT